MKTKSYSLFLAGMLLLNQNIIAQKGNIKVAIVGGTNIAFPVGADVKQARLNMKTRKEDPVTGKQGTFSGSITPKVGIHLGGTVSYFITDQFAVNSGLIFSQRGHRSKSESEIPQTVLNPYNNTEFSYKEKNGSKSKMNFNYIDLPLAANYYLNKSFYVNGGLQMCFLLSSNYKYESTSTDITYDNTGPPYDPPTVEYKTDLGTGTLPAKGVIIGFQLGGGFAGEKMGFSFGMSKTGDPAGQLGFGFYGYPNLTVQAGLTYSFDVKL